MSSGDMVRRCIRSALTGSAVACVVFVVIVAVGVL